MVTDPIADMITRLRNAARAGLPTTSVDYSNFKMAVAEVLLAQGFITSATKKGKKVKKTIDIMLKYNEAGMHVINGVRRISKPGRRIYRGAREIVSVRYGHGSLVLSTPRGVMTDKEARKEKVGGEALFEIW